MTDSIDLDEITVENEEEPSGNSGDWLWRDDATDETAEADAEASGSDSEGAESPPETSSSGGAAPGVPATSDDPVGVPGNAGEPLGQDGDAGDAADQNDNAGDAADRNGNADQSTQGAGTAETHGAAEPDDMTMALTYKAAHYFTDPEFVFSDARGWADWIGIVGEVSTPVIRKFQRDNRVELDFFGGSEAGPESRLKEIDRESMFFAERMVLVGTDADEWIAEAAGWEFVPVETAAEKADWELRDDL